MKSTAFGDRARQLSSWFLEWNQCEQTIALYSLLTKVSATQARFFSLVLEHILQGGQDQQELARMEADANDPTFLSAIHSKQDSIALSHLLSHILLLHPGNDQAREEYLKLLPKVLFGSAEDPEYLYQCRQLLSLALVHPAFPHQDREKLTFWLSRLDDKCRNIAEKNGLAGGVGNTHHRSATLPIQTHHHSSGTLHSSTLHSSSPPRRIYQLRTESCDDIINVGGSHRNGSNRIYINVHQSNPIGSTHEFDALGEIDTHPYFDDDEELVSKGFTYSNHVQEQHCSTPNGYDEYMKRVKNKSLSLPANRAPSACSLPATLDEKTAPIFWKPGMKDVPIWLKSLRLHKYQDLFVDMTYESLLGITEEFLHKKNITKGALNKILVSIEKLRQRADRLAEIEQDTEKQGELLSCIHRIRQILLTPIKPYTPPEEQPITIASSTTASSVTNEGETETVKPSRTTTTAGGEEGTQSVEGSPQHGSSIQQEEAGGSSEDSACSTPPSSPCLRRSSSMSSVDDLLAKDFSESDLPALITRAIGKVYSQLMMHTETNEENLTAFIKLLDIAMCHEAFRVSHKKMFFEWKQQCQQTLRVLSPKKSPRNRGWPNAFTIAGNPPQPKVPFPDKKTGRRSNLRNTMGAKVPTSIMGSPRSSSTLPKASTRQFQPPFPPPFYPPPRSRSNTGSSVKQSPIPIPSVIKSHRYVNMTIPKPAELSEMQMDELCKSVTEHALEDQGDFY